jgi:hypothetical protein
MTGCKAGEGGVILRREVADDNDRLDDGKEMLANKGRPRMTNNRGICAPVRFCGRMI